MELKQQNTNDVELMQQIQQVNDMEMLNDVEMLTDVEMLNDVAHQIQQVNMRDTL